MKQCMITVGRSDARVWRWSARVDLWVGLWITVEARNFMTQRGAERWAERRAQVLAAQNRHPSGGGSHA